MAIRQSSWNMWFCTMSRVVPGLLEVGAAALHADRLRHGDLHVVHVLLVPQRLEDRVGEAEDQQVLDRLLAQVVVDAVDVPLGEDAVDLLGSARGRGLRSWPIGFSSTIRVQPPSRAGPVQAGRAQPARRWPGTRTAAWRGRTAGCPAVPCSRSTVVEVLGQARGSSRGRRRRPDSRRFRRPSSSQRSASSVAARVALDAAPQLFDERLARSAAAGRRRRRAKRPGSRPSSSRLYRAGTSLRRVRSPDAPKMTIMQGSAARCVGAAARTSPSGDGSRHGSTSSDSAGLRGRIRLGGSIPAAPGAIIVAMWENANELLATGAQASTAALAVAVALAGAGRPDLRAAAAAASANCPAGPASGSCSALLLVCLSRVPRLDLLRPAGGVDVRGAARLLLRRAGPPARPLRGPRRLPGRSRSRSGRPSSAPTSMFLATVPVTLFLLVPVLPRRRAVPGGPARFDGADAAGRAVLRVLRRAPRAAASTGSPAGPAASCSASWCWRPSCRSGSPAASVPGPAGSGRSSGSSFSVAAVRRRRLSGSGPGAGWSRRTPPGPDSLVAIAVTLGAVVSRRRGAGPGPASSAAWFGRGAFLNRMVPAVYAAPVFFHYLNHFA